MLDHTRSTHGGATRHGKHDREAEPHTEGTGSGATPEEPPARLNRRRTEAEPDTEESHETSDYEEVRLQYIWG